MISGKKVFGMFLIFIAIAFVIVFSVFAFSNIKATQTVDTVEYNATNTVINTFSIFAENYDILGILVFVIVIAFFAWWVWASVRSKG